jgi:hypothetical protein
MDGAENDCLTALVTTGTSIFPEHFLSIPIGKFFLLLSICESQSWLYTGNQDDCSGMYLEHSCFSCSKLRKVE